MIFVIGQMAIMSLSKIILNDLWIQIVGEGEEGEEGEFKKHIKLALE